MTSHSRILVGTFEHFSWIRCEGKGSFLNSPELKAYGGLRIAAGERCLVMDLGSCTGMDSTFMGTLAGLAARLSVIQNGKLQIACAGEKNRRSLEDLGLDFLMEIDPEEASWQSNIIEIRASLQSPELARQADERVKAEHILEAHETLAECSESNARKFATVVDLLKTELADRKEPKE